MLVVKVERDRGEVGFIIARDPPEARETTA